MRDPGEAVVEAVDVAVGYGGAAILEGVHLRVPRGKVFCILGGSGSGKSTLMRALVGLEPPMSGLVRIHGAAPDLGGRPQVGVMFQSGALFGSMTLYENVALPIRTWSRLDRRGLDAVVRSKLRLVGLDGYEHHLPEELSGGMRKRAGIARALALDPDVLFLDEPSAGLDPVTSAELDYLIRMLARDLQVTCVVVTHELDSVYAIADDCVLLDREARGVIARGDPRRLRDESPDPRVRRFFRREPSSR